MLDAKGRNDERPASLQLALEPQRTVRTQRSQEMAGIIFGCIMLVLVGWAILKGKYAPY